MKIKGLCNDEQKWDGFHFHDIFKYRFELYASQCHFIFRILGHSIIRFICTSSALVCEYVFEHCLFIFVTQSEICKSHLT